MSEWSNHHVRVGKRDFIATMTSDVLVGFEFEITGDFFEKEDPVTARIAFDRDNTRIYSQQDWFTTFPTPQHLIENFRLMVKTPVTYGQCWYEEGGDEDARPAIEDDIKPDYAYVDNMILHYGEIESWSQVTRAFHLTDEAERAYQKWAEGECERDFCRWYEGTNLDERKTDVINDVRKAIEERTGLTVRDYSPEYREWFITRDASIAPAGAELVSPPMALLDAIEKLHLVLRSIVAPLSTNDTTGLHINISVPETDRIDLLKLILLMGEGYILDTFQRRGNGHAKSIVEHATALYHSRVKERDYLSVISAMNALLREHTHHGFSIDVGKLKKGYLEFRLSGGAGYEGKAQEIEDTVLRFVRCIELASDVNAERKSYLKKLHAFMTKG